jgi:cell division protein FtsA
MEGYNLKDIIFSLDIGTRSIIGVVGVIEDDKFKVLAEKYKEHEERAMIDGQIHDISLVAKTVGEVKESLEQELGIKLKYVSIAAAGRFLRTSEAKTELVLNGDEEINKEIVRSLELGAVKKAEEKVNKNTEGKLYCVGYSVKGFYLNSYIISNLLGHKGENVGCEVIATFLPRSVVDSLYAVVDKVELAVANLTLEPIAAIEAAVPKKLRLLNIALVDIGAGTSDIAISSKEAISAFGMVPMAGDEVTEVIAQECLVDFNTAENIKRTISESYDVTYTDVLGIENTITAEDVYRIIKGTVVKIAEAVSSKILECNGNKPPAAVFLVGGGAHTPFIIEELSKFLTIEPKRIAIKDRKSVEECIADYSLGSAGVTVLGIALTAIRKLGENFIDVKFNGEVVSLFNSHSNTVLDVLLQAGINPALLIGKNGKSLRFTVNGKKRLVFGDMGKNAKITVNSKKADTETKINSGDEIKVTFSKNGKDGAAALTDFISQINSISIYLDDNIINIEPVFLINGIQKPINAKIKNEDEILVLVPDKIADFTKYVLKEEKAIYKGNEQLSAEYILSDGDKIYSKLEALEKETETLEQVEEILESEIEVIEPEYTVKVEEPLKKIEQDNTVDVLVNKKHIILTGKKEYVFVDIFNSIDFDLTTLRGNALNLILNGSKAAYTDKLKDGDEIEVFWS